MSPHPNLQNLWILLYVAKGVCRYKLRILRWETTLNYLGVSHVVTRVFIGGTQRTKVREG